MFQFAWVCPVGHAWNQYIAGWTFGDHKELRSRQLRISVPRDAWTPGSGRLTAMSILARVGLGLILLVVGILTVPTPVPVGAFLIILAMTLLLPAYEPLGRVMRHMRSRNRRLDRWMTAGARRGPKFIRQAWRTSSPRRKTPTAGQTPKAKGDVDASPTSGDLRKTE